MTVVNPKYQMIPLLDDDPFFAGGNHLTSWQQRTSSGKSPGRLCRIRALRDFDISRPDGETWYVKAGDIGGVVGQESNLAHSGNCWIWNNAFVAEDASVEGDAQISGEASVLGDALITGNALIGDSSWVSGSALVTGDSRLLEYARVADRAVVLGSSLVAGGVVRGSGYISDSSILADSIVLGNARIEKSSISGAATVSGRVEIKGSVIATVKISGLFVVVNSVICHWDKLVMYSNVRLVIDGVRIG